MTVDAAKVLEVAGALAALCAAALPVVRAGLSPAPQPIPVRVAAGPRGRR